MAFNNSPGRAEYTATAGQTVFTYVFKAYNDTDIKVYLTPAGQVADDVADLLTLTTDYTVVVSGDVGGTITLVVPASNGDSITLVRTLEIDRQIEYQTSGDLLADTLNQDQNYQTYLIADKESDNTRFLKLQESAQGVSTEIPSPVPLNFFQWNATGDAIINVDSLQADGFLWTAADVYTKSETYSSAEVDTLFSDNAKLWDGQTTTHDFTTDADYTLTTAQNGYGRIVLTDTGVVLTTARNVITDNVQKSFIVQNDTLQSITVKTLAGTGIIVPAGSFSNLYNDGVNVILNDKGATGVLSVDDFIHVQDQKPNGTGGGTPIVGFNTRVLNTVLTNTITGASLATNQVTLPAGEYYAEVEAPAYNSNSVKVQLYNVTDTASILVGTSGYGLSTAGVSIRSAASGKFTIAATKTISLRHYFAVASGSGLGIATTNGDVEVYADVKIWKVG